MAVPTISITGSIVSPDARIMTTGTIRADLSNSGSALDGVGSVTVSGRSVGAVTGGLVSMVLVANDLITPSGTYYYVTFDCIDATGRKARWSEKWQLVSGSATLDIGSIPRIDVVPGLSLAPYSVPGDASAMVVDSGGTVDRTLSARFSEVVNIKDFGAVGDGVTDDSDALIAAVAAVAARVGTDTPDYGQGSGGVVYVPRGIYLITKQIAINTNGLTIRGEGENATAFKVAITTNPTTTDAFKIGNGTGAGRRSGLEHLSIFTDTNYGTNKVRDFLYIDGATWWKCSNVNMRNAGRYGVRIGGTLHGTFYNLHVSYCGDSGVRIEESSTAVEHTSSDWHHLYSHDNWKHGVHIAGGNVIGLYSPILEYNGKSGDPAAASGLKIGDAIDSGADVTIINGYWEGNLGWDIHTGAGLSGGVHNIHLIGGMASATGGAQSKTAGGVYGFFYGSRAAGSFMGINLANYTTGLGYLTYSLDNTCKVSILGQQGNLTSLGYTNRPVNRSGAVGINDYRGGIIEWPDQNGGMTLLGSYSPRVGYFGAGAASIALHSRGAAPTSGIFDTGDVVFNRAPQSRWDTPGWVNTAGGSPGTFQPLPTPVGSSGDRGDADVTLTARATQPIQRFDTTLTTNRTVTLSTTGAVPGDWFRIVRTGLGAFTLNVGGIKTIPSATAAFVDVMYDESTAGWRLTGYGTL